VAQISPHAVAAVGITESMMTIIYAIGVGLSSATTALVARRIGEKKPESASVAALQAIMVGFSISIFIAVPGFLFGSDLLGLITASPDIIEIGGSYTSIMLGGNGILILLFVINAVFRSAGDAATSMRVLFLANALNIVLDYCLIFGFGPFPELGVKGAAIATNTGRGIAVIYQFYLLFRGNRRIQLFLNRLKLDFEVMKSLLKLSLGGIGQSIIATSSWIGMVKIIAVFGSDVIAGYTIGIRIIIFALLPSWGLSNSVSTLVGQNLGAGKPERAEKAVWNTVFINMTLLGTAAIVFVSFPEFFIKLFIDEPAVVAYGAVCLRFISFGYVSYAVVMVMAQAFNGAGDTATPTKINFICFWLMEIPLAWLLAIPMGMGEKGVYIAIISAETVLAVMGFVLFKKGRWKTRKV
ncbi:MAG: MATE family efflux transporter, partial [bacterium]|nr:MATE family efflux transporter [bacterium]